MSSNISKVQKFTKTQYVFEWRINDFFSISDVRLTSSTFYFGEEPWYMVMYPMMSPSFLDVRLHRKFPGSTKSLLWSIALKTGDGKKDNERQSSDIFQGIRDNDCQKNMLFSRSDVLEKQSILLSSGALTVVCTIYCCSRITDDGDNTFTETECSYCKSRFHTLHISIHEEMCLNIRCSTCKRKWDDHQCAELREKANQKLVEDLTAILNSGEHGDLAITVKDTEFRLHRAILAGRNPYFNSMLNTEMKEKVTGTVTIEDCEPDIFRSFIHFVYTGKVGKMSVENVYDLYKLADRCQADQLKDECLDFMEREMRVDTFCDFMAVAVNHDEKQLLQKATEFFCKNIKRIIKSAKWQSFVEHYFTQSNELTIKALDFHNL